MKNKVFLSACLLSLWTAAFSQQDIRLSDIAKPGETGIAEKRGIILAENIFGPRKVVFSGNAPGSAAPVLSKEETGRSGGKGAFDKLEMSFSGRIYSPNMSEPILFENKTPEEMGLLEIPVFPIILEQPYTLFMDLTIKATSKPIGASPREDAGIYRAVLNVTLVRI